MNPCSDSNQARAKNVLFRITIGLLALWLCGQPAALAQTFFEDFNGAGIPSGWVDLSQSGNHPTVGTVDGRSVLILTTGPGNVPNIDIGLELAGLNPGNSLSWAIEYVARDGIPRAVCDCNGGFGVGQNQSYWAAPEHWVMFGVGIGLGLSYSPDYRGHIWWDNDYNPFFSTNVPRDDAFHLFRIESDGQDLRWYIDGMLVRTEQGKAFPAHRIELGIYGSQQESSTLWIDSVKFMVPAEPPMLSELTPAMVWLGVKNSDDVGTKFDLLAEVYKNETLVGAGQLNDVPGGSSGFNNAKLNAVPLTLFATIPFDEGESLAIKLYVRIAASSRHRSGTARLWYNDSSANSRFGATINGVNNDYYLVGASLLDFVPGPGPKYTRDVFVDRAIGGNPFKAFGTWRITP
jgi:hypothetical protein